MKRETSTQTRRDSLAERRWFLVNAHGRVVGRVATTIARILRGKNNPAFSPHLDCGDFVVVINARHVQFSGRKWQDKMYYRHTGFPGGIRATSAEKLHVKQPEAVLRKAVVGMLPKTRLGRVLATKLKIYPDDTHPHGAQQPRAVEEESRYGG